MNPILLACISGVAASFGPAHDFSVIHKFVIGGDGGWDTMTVDSSSHRLYLSRSTRVTVVDTETGKVVGEVTDTPGVHGIAIDPATSEGFTSNGRDNSVTVFDTKTLEKKETVKVGQNPDVIIFDPASNHVLAFNGRSNDATVLDAASHKVVATIALGGKPEFGQADGKGSVWVNIEDKSEVEEIDTRSNKVGRTWSLNPGEEPSGLAVDPSGHRLFSVCSNNKMVVSDFKSGKVTGSVAIGNGPDSAAYDPAWKLAMSPNGQDGTLDIVDVSGEDPKVVQTVKTMVSARTMAYDAKAHRAYLLAAEFDAPVGGARRGQMKPGTATVIVVGVP